MALGEEEGKCVRAEWSKMHSHGLMWKHLSMFHMHNHHEIHLVFTHCFNLQHTDLWRILGCSLHIYQMEKHMSPLILGWPKSLFGFFCKLLGENPNELSGQPDTEEETLFAAALGGKGFSCPWHPGKDGVLGEGLGGGASQGPGCLLIPLVLALLHPGLTCQDLRLLLCSSGSFLEDGVSPQRCCE